MASRVAVWRVEGPSTIVIVVYRRWHRRLVDYFVYILHCADRSLYIGHTEDVDARVETHNRGEGAAFTRRRLPVLVVFTERHPSRQAASARERQIKRWTRAKKEALITGNLAALKRL